jgi:small subunit ribosomal protein S17
MDTPRNRRKTVEGEVTSTKMAKTITVLVGRTYRHAKYGKFLRKQVKYHAHDEDGVAQMGDRVEIVECRPTSRLKRWRLVRVIEKAKAAGQIEFAVDGGLS